MKRNAFHIYSVSINLSLLISIIASLVGSSGTFAAQTVHLPNLSAADAFGKKLHAELALEIANESASEDVLIEVKHDGVLAEIPEELTWVVDHLKRLETQFDIAVDVSLKLVGRGMLLPTEGGKSGDQYFIRYDDSEPKLDRGVPSLATRAGVAARSFFGVPNGISWVMYKLSFTERTPKEHAVELASAALQASGLYLINYAILTEKLAEQPDLVADPVRASLVAGGWKLLTAYIERANNAFFAQGNRWDPVHHFRMNRQFALSGAYLHSILIGVTVQLGAHGFDGLSQAILAHTAWNSFLGLFAKSEPLLLIAKHQRKSAEVEDSGSLKHSKWKTIALNFAFAMVYQATKAVHFYELDFLNIPTLFAGLGMGGVTYEIIKYFRKGNDPIATPDGYTNSFSYGWRRFKYRLNRLNPGASAPSCQSLLTIRRKAREDES